jgi:hypothetical protein
LAALLAAGAAASAAEGHPPSPLPFQLESPVDFAVGPDGDFYVLEANEAKKLARVRILAASGKVTGVIGAYSEKPEVRTAALLSSEALEVDENRNVFVATKVWGAVSVSKFDAMGAPYLADGEGFKGGVKQFDAQGRLVRTHEFKTCPFELCVRKGVLYVGESQGTWSFDCQTGKALANWAGKASKAFAVGEQGELLLFKFGYIRTFDATGVETGKISLNAPEPLRKAGSLVVTTKALLVTSPESRCVYRFGLDGSFQAKLAEGLTLTKLYAHQGSIYGLDSEKAEILRLAMTAR